jgi:fatty-acyl-CoA synthase
MISFQPYFQDTGDQKLPNTANGSGHSSSHAWRRALEMTASISNNTAVTFPTIIETLGDKFETAIALFSGEQCLTYRALAESANRYARWALAQRVAAGDVVCLLMPNCPEYMAIWLGVSRIGGVVALVNTNLVGAALEHSINIVAPKHIIVGAALIDAFATVLPRLDPGIGCWTYGDGTQGLLRIDLEIENGAGETLRSSEYRPPSIWDRALYIYTSGTTGLPKAAGVSHFRIMQWTHWFAGLIDARPTDRMYNCLPMYHSIGGVVASGAVLLNGGSVAIRERFSASRFWDDIAEWNCTLFQYIGELCRYLVNSPPHPREIEHHLRLCCGNGLQADVWEEFQRRFQIPQILEFYAATEGSFSLFNCEGKPGAIGRIPSFLAHRFPVALVKFDVETGEPLRNEEGFCQRCSANEVGEAIGRISSDRSTSVERFEGYSDSEASDRKILHNVFAVGDAWYRTGDLMRRDQGGYFYFVDRIGDSYRWKGENVSTTEVEQLVRTCPGIVEAVVYGVRVSGMEGRAGMAAIVTGDEFDLVEFHQHMFELLPDYARPVFLRLCGEIEVTGTFKLQKQRLMHEAYDPVAISDHLYFNDRVSDAYVRLDHALFELIRNGTVRP